MSDHFHFQIPGLSEPEEDIADAFVYRMQEIAMEEGQALDLWIDGGPILTGMVKERLPHYSREQMVEFIVQLLEAIGGALQLDKTTPEGHA